MTLKCNMCSKKFSRIDNLKSHEEAMHGIQRLKRVRLECPECDFNALKLDTFRSHLVSAHNKILLCRVMDFDSMDAFKKWKYEEEVKSNSFFAKSCGIKKLQDCTKTYFMCNRSGHFVSHGFGKRSPRVIGSVKMGKTCPASITLEERNGKLKVMYFSEHIGHSNHSVEAVKSLRLPLADRQAIEDKLARGTPLNKILEDVRSSLAGKELTRLHLLKKKDLYNILRDYKAKSDAKKAMIAESNEVVMKLQVAIKMLRKIKVLPKEVIESLKEPVNCILNNIKKVEKLQENECDSLDSDSMEFINDDTYDGEDVVDDPSPTVDKDIEIGKDNEDVIETRLREIVGPSENEPLMGIGATDGEESTSTTANTCELKEEAVGSTETAKRRRQRKVVLLSNTRTGEHAYIKM